jgi:hypothetical protein
MMPSVQRCIRFLNIFGSDQQLGLAHGWIHSTSIVGPDHGLDADLIQNALRDLCIRR